MPTYQYACRECGHAFDQVQSFSDDTLTDCPECEGRLRKVFNAVGVVFKGSGFYRNDSRKKESSVRDGRLPGQGRRGTRRGHVLVVESSSRSSSGSSVVGLVVHDVHQVSPADRQLRVLHSPAARG